ncbi:MAG: MgtC/SapB family protein [Acidobacteria bacterium]|nr:MgtC/SapB family protein [Acidobacteriota bacterium]
MVPLSDAELIQRLLLAAAVGALLGAERELRRKSAGFRTNILIAMGSALFTIVSMTLAPNASDPTRMAAQIVTGIGFLGAGVILHNDNRVQGLTTAATVWVNAALGVAAGGGQYRVAVLGAAITLSVLLILGPLERAIERRAMKADGGNGAAGQRATREEPYK